MKTTTMIVAAIAVLACAYGLGYYQRGLGGSSDPYELRISIDGSEAGMTLKALAPGDTLSLDAMEVTVRNETAPDPEAQFPHQYGTQCPLKDGDPAKVIGQSGDTVLMEVVASTPDGLFNAGDRFVRHDMDVNVSRTVFYCPVGTLFLIDRVHADLERVHHLSEAASRQHQQQIDAGERTMIRDLLRQNGGR